MDIEKLRKKIRPRRYLYLLIDKDGNEFWLNTMQLEKRKEAIISRKAISLRLNMMFDKNRKGCTFKTIMDCISRPATRSNVVYMKSNSIGDINYALSLMKIPKSLRN